MAEALYQQQKQKNTLRGLSRSANPSPFPQIDMDHPENWPKHYPPFYESRRPARYPLLRAVFIAFGLYQAYLFWTNPMWLIPWVTPNFECISNEGNWVKLEDHDEKDRVYPWQKPLVEPELRSPEARRALGYNIVLEGEDKKL